MATKNYSAMSTKKLQALLENASEEEQALIQQELSSREPQPQVPADGNYADPIESPLTEEEERILKQAEANGGINAMYEKTKAKPTLEELEAIMQECKVNIGHRCNVVPFNTIEWLQGYISGVTADKRAGKVLYAIKLDNGKRIVKAYNSPYLNILDEVVDMAAIRGNIHRAATTQVERVALSEEERAQLMAKERLNIGKRINVQVGTETDEATGETLASYVEGRITAISFDRRTDKVIYAVQIPNVDGTSRKVFRTNNNIGYEIIDELDALGIEMQDAAQKRFNHVPKAKAAIKEFTREKLTRKIEQTKKLIENSTAKLKAYEEQLQALGEEQETSVTAPIEESEELI